VLNEHISEQTNVFCTIEHVSISHPGEKSNRYPTTITAITSTTILANGIVTPYGPRNPESHPGPGGIARRGTTKSDRLHSVFSPVLPSQSQEAILLLARRLHINGRPEWDAAAAARWEAVGRESKSRPNSCCNVLKSSGPVQFLRASGVGQAGECMQSLTRT
jgi:hypothetical protein